MIDVAANPGLELACSWHYKCWERHLIGPDFASRKPGAQV